jgi:ligand-binding sensor domain-containing protein
MRIVTLISIFSFLCAFLQAQNESYIHYSSRNGLPGNVIYSICEDSEGYIWIGGASGLSRFDGTYFTNYSIHDGIPDIEILKLEKDRQGRIWMLGFNGKIAYIQNGRIFGEKKVPLLKRVKLKGAPCFFHQTPQNDIEITDEKGFVVVLKFDQYNLKAVKYYNRKVLLSIKTGNQRITLFRKSSTIRRIKQPLHYLINTPITVERESIVVRDEQEIIRVSAKGITRILPLSPEHKVQQMHVDNTNHLWYYDGSSQTINNYDLVNKKPPIAKYQFPFHFNRFFIDSRGNVWVCSQNKGLFLYPKKWQSSKQITFPESSITALFYTSNGCLIAGNTYSAISFFDPKNLHLIYHIKQPGEKIYFPVRGFKESCNNTLCAYGYFKNEVIPCSPTKTKQLKLINGKDVSFDCKGNMLVTTSSRLIRLNEIDFDGSTDLSAFRSYAVCSFSHDEYIYSNVFGLYYVKGKISKRIQADSELFSNRISHIEKLSDGNLFMLTDGVGCSVFNRKTLKPEGPFFSLPEVNDYRGLFIQKDTIWLATNNGIIVLKYADKTLQFVRKIGTLDGLMSNDVLAIACSENNIYASTPEGLSKLTKSTLLAKLTPPKLKVAYVAVDGVVRYETNIKVTKIPKEIVVRLSALHFGSRAPLEFSYSLNNGNSWNNTNSPNIHLQNLNQGDLAVLVRARKVGGNWSDVQKMMISIPLPFFKLLWVQLILFLVVVGIVVWLTVTLSGRIRKKQLAAKDIQLTLADLELKSLRSMMNTHFVFNALNSIQQFISGKNHLEANRYLGKFSRLMRSHLNASLDTYIPLTEELQSLDHYLSLEKLRLEERLEYTFCVPDLLPTLSIPGFILQPLVENAIWHGLMPLEAGGKVEIVVELSDTELTISIRDNGVGLKPNHNQNHSSRGIQMIHQRLEILSDRTGRKHHLLLRNEMDATTVTGVTAIITIARI